MPCPIETFAAVPHVLEKIFGTLHKSQDTFLACLNVNTTWKKALGTLGERFAEHEEKSFLHDWFEKKLVPNEFQIEGYVVAVFLACNAKWCFLSMQVGEEEANRKYFLVAYDLSVKDQVTPYATITVPKCHKSDFPEVCSNNSMVAC